MDNPRIVMVEWACLEGYRPRPLGKNARLDGHGSIVQVPLLRLTTEDGLQGFGICRAGRERAITLLGKRLSDVFALPSGVLPLWGEFDYPLWDLIGMRSKLPVYALVASLSGTQITSPFRVPCYDTSLYFDDLHLATHEEAAQLLISEVREGYERGHRAFKLKVGRGARHMPMEEGTQRDITIIRAVRKAIGPDISLMIDANCGYTLNLAKHVLRETAECALFWLEEPFHEDEVLYRDLRIWLGEQHLSLLISDGEGQADPRLLEWARQGLVDVIQYNYLDHGFTNWLLTGRQLDEWGVRSAPHHFGTHYGNYVTGHLAAAIRGFTFVEWDEATTPGLDTSSYQVSEGSVTIPGIPGFGLRLDETIYQRAVAQTGYRLQHS